MCLVSWFQFTHPGRGATDVVGVDWGELDVSIHAPREGCDVHQSAYDVRRDVSIHAPREGCDIVSQPVGELTLGVSIHAPREGCDPRETIQQSL